MEADSTHNLTVTYMWQWTASVSSRSVLTAGVFVLAHASIRTDERCAEAHQSQTQDPHLQSLKTERGGQEKRRQERRRQETTGEEKEGESVVKYDSV